MIGDPLIIQLRANETAGRTGNPHVPFSPEEIVADALDAAAAGASILHWHARDPVSGRTTTQATVNAEICAGVRSASELLLHPTLGGSEEQDPLARMRHIATLCEQPATRVDLVPVDFGSFNIDLWDAGQRRFRSDHRVYLNPRSGLRLMLERARALEVAVVSECWTVGHIRTARRFQELGLLGWSLWELVFTGEEMPDGMAPTRRGLEAMIEQVPEGQPWSVACMRGDVLELAAWAIELGGHVSVGLGDWPYRELGQPSNAELVAHVAALAQRRGRRAATPQETRRLLRLAPAGGAGRSTSR